MKEDKELRVTLEKRIENLLDKLQMDQEKKPLRLALQFGYLSYVRLFVESQRRESLQPYFPYAGFPMEWTRGEEKMDGQQRIWQVKYQVQYCSSIVEEGHFMEQADVIEKANWIEELCLFIDQISDSCSWEEGMPRIFGMVLEEIVRQIYVMGTSGMFLMPKALTEMMMQLAGQREVCEMWNPCCRTGAFLAAVYRNHSNWKLTGSEEDKDQCLLAQMLQFYHGVMENTVTRENSLEKEEQIGYDLIVSNPPVGELSVAEQDRFPVSTRKIQLQYLQMIMKHLKKHGLAIVVINEGALFKFDAEMKVRKELLESFELQGVISLPASAFLPYTSAKASILIFANAPERVGEHSAVWFYELKELGYTLDRRQEATGISQIPELLKSWNQRKEMEVEWKRQLAKGEQYNQWNNPVPENWTEGSYWFADRKTIRQNDYNITAGRYKPWKEEQEEVAESPLELLEQLADMEQETMEQIKELIEMTKHYE